MEMKELSNFALSQIPNKFRVADFARKQYTHHTRRIMKAIMEGKLYDNVITVLDTNDEKYLIIDGQHRLAALKSLYEEDKLRGFTIFLRICKGVKDKEIYLNINKAKAMTSSDYFKVFDDGTRPFFTDLSRLCSHYGDKNHLKFSHVLSAMSYSKIGDATANRETMEAILNKIDKYEISTVRNILEDMKYVFGNDVRVCFFKSSMLKNIMKVYFSNEEKILKSEKKNFQGFLKKLTNDRFIQTTAVIRHADGMLQLHQYLEGKLNKYFDEVA